MKIIITGANGLIGSRAVKVFRAYHEVVGVDIDTVDLCKYALVKKLFQETKPDFVLHCAANGNVNECEADHDTAVRNNIIATRNLASLCADYSSGMILCSTDHVYRYTELPETLHEYNETKGASFYGFTKVICEREVQAKVKRHYIARLCWQYGLFEAGLPQDMRRVGMVDIAIDSYRHKVPIRVAKGSRHYTSNVYDTIDVFLAMIEGKLPYGVYNVASENNLTLKELYITIFQKLGATEEEIKQLVIETDEEPYVLTPEPYYLKLSGYRMPTFEEGLDRFFREAELDRR